MEKIYIDIENRKELPEINGKEVIFAGKKFDPFVMTCEENGFTFLQRRRKIYLIFQGMIPKLDFYPVPGLTFFAYDGEGGYFAHNGKSLMEAKIYFVSEKRECWYLAEDFRTFVQMVVFEPNWKEKITGKQAEIQETGEELADFGMLFGFSAPKEKFTEKIERAHRFKIFGNIEKAREKMYIL